MSPALGSAGSAHVHHWACEVRSFDFRGEVVGEVTRKTFDTYEQARQHADSEVTRGGKRIGAVVFALRRGGPPDGAAFEPGKVREQ